MIVPNLYTFHNPFQAYTLDLLANLTEVQYELVLGGEYA
jgi:hypothetical protein